MSTESEDERPRLRARDMVGIFGSDWTGGMSSVEWVRAQRDDEYDAPAAAGGAPGPGEEET